jgi:hypothetical protein
MSLPKKLKNPVDSICKYNIIAAQLYLISGLFQVQIETITGLHALGDNNFFGGLFTP